MAEAKCLLLVALAIIPASVLAGYHHHHHGHDDHDDHDHHGHFQPYGFGYDVHDGWVIFLIFPPFILLSQISSLVVD